ncbi:MAG: molybdenum cofactor biosynthesis protein MoaE [Dehalococcoidales bacterium]|nr:molybdenum cofactor biosynthesis protein MoaE [Dehalococcoidales bacterium]
MSIIEITEVSLSPDLVVGKVKTEGSGCVVTYVGLIRNQSRGKHVLSVEYRDPAGNASDVLNQIASEAGRKWPVENVAISHRTGKLRVGEINLVVAVASAHRGEGFSACQYIIDQFKERLPTEKTETYQDGTIFHQ